jgi:sodium transport system permease protein
MIGWDMIRWFRTVFFKELKDAFRDRRSVVLAIVYGLMGPASVLIGMLASQNQAGVGKQVEVTVSGAQYAPALMSHFESRDIAIKPGAKVSLVIPDDYAQKLADAEPITLTLTGGRRDDSRAMDRIETAVSEYAQTLAVQRLILRGVAPAALQPMSVETRNTDTATAFALILAQVMLFYFLVAPAGSGMSLAIDTTAGERERHSLETLLARPVPRPAIVLGKWLAVMVFGLLGVLITGATIYLASSFGLIAKLGVRFDLTPLDLVLAVLLVLPFAGLIAALQVAVGFAARSFKEAQAYIGFTLIIPIVLGLIASMDVIDAPWVKSMPIFVEVNGLKTLLTTDSYALRGWFASSAIEIILIILLLMISSRRLNSGKMLPAD